MNSLSPRGLDHLVLPTAGLETARNRLASLGFRVAPDGSHPFGTTNCCVYFDDGTFIEPLAVADAAKSKAAADAGNVFVSHDSNYRADFGQEGFSAIVFGTDDAAADHKSFVEAGFSAGDPLEFSRPFKDASGRSETASFRLAFAGDRASPAVLAFTCQRIDTPDVDRAALQQHPNGVESIGRIVAVAEDRDRFGSFLARVINDVASDDKSSMTFDLGGNAVEVLDRDGFAAIFGSHAEALDQLAAIVFVVTDLAATGKLLDDAGVGARKAERMLIVERAPGQGAIFAFEENRR